jgi:hypothetical protein
MTIKLDSPRTEGTAQLVSSTLGRTLPLDGSLDLSESNITDDDLARIIKEYQNAGIEITSLDISYCKNITNVGLQRLSALRSLKVLNLNHCLHITDKGLSHITVLPSLSELYLSDCDITDKALSHLSAIRSLTKLVFSHCSKITDRGLESLSTLPSLETLFLWNCDKITDTGLKHLSTIRSLTKLELNNCFQITDQGYQYLSVLPIKNLSFYGCYKMSDQTLQSTPIAVAAHLQKWSPFNAITSDKYGYSDLHKIITGYLDI